MSFQVLAAYTDYALTDIVLPNTVRAGEDLNVTFVITSNTVGNVNVDINLYSPSGALLINSSRLVAVGQTNFTISNTANDLNFSTQPYMIRGYISTADDNPANNIYSKYFTVTRSTNKVPVSDIPLFSGIIIALLFLFILSYNKSTKTKKWLIYVFTRIWFKAFKKSWRIKS